MGISFSLAHTGRFGEVTERVCGIERVATTPRIRILPCSHGWLGDLGLINTFLQGPGGKGFSWERNFGIRESVLWVPPGMTPNFFRFFFLFYFFFAAPITPLFPPSLASEKMLLLLEGVRPYEHAYALGHLV